MNKIFVKALSIISKMEQEKVSPKTFIHNNIQYFSDIPIGSLIAPECRQKDFYSEKAYVFLIGSYIYFRIFSKPVTWFERRRFAEFSLYSELFSNTICTDIGRRYATLDELKKIILKRDEKSSSPLSPEGVIGMRIAIKGGSVITLKEVGTDNEHDFTIVDTIGVGASCIVYTAIYRDAEGNEIKVRLKEFYPESLNIERNADNSLDMGKCDNSRYLQRFTEGYRRQLQFRSIPDSMNSISNIQGILEGNNTKYIAMSCQNGIGIDEAELSLYDIFRLLKAITFQIDNFHKKDYLYLDLKPANVILYPETPELVMLFDFDSAVKRDKITLDDLSFTQKWSAPEVVQRKVKKIGIPSDIYTLGALLMYMLFQRSPEIYDRRRSSDWNNDFENSILSDESPEVKRMVTEIFKNTLSAEPERRYASCSELLDVIEPFIQSFQKQKPYLQTILPMNNNFFCGRKREINAIHELLKSSNFLILHGIGGIGKSELAKHYAEKYSSEYDAVIFVRYDGSIVETFANDTKFPVVNLERDDDENDEEYFARKIRVLQKICTPRHLIILDNFDTDECEHLDELLALNCRFLITSRVDFEDIFPQFEVNVLDEIDDLRDIFSYYSKLENAEYSDNIIIALEGHTMTVELVSKQMKLNDLTSKEMYEKLCENGISADESKVKNMKDGSLRNKSAVAHMEILFNVFNTSDDLRKVLSHIAMIGTVSIKKEDFVELCDFDNAEKDLLNKAIRSGWIQIYGNCLQVHPLVSEVLLSELQPDLESYWRLEKSVVELSEELDELSGEKRAIIEKIIEHICKHIYVEEGSDETGILIDFYRHIADIYADRGDYHNAEKYMVMYMDIAEKFFVDDPDEYRYEYLILCSYAREQGNFERTDYYLNKARGKVDEDSFYLELIDYFYAKENYDTAKEYCFKVINISSEPFVLYSTYRSLILIEIDTDNDQKRIHKYGREMVKYAQLRIADTDISEPEKYISAICDYIMAYMFCGDYSKALQIVKNAEVVIKENDLRNSVVAIQLYPIIAECYGISGMNDKAIEAIDKGINIVEEHYSESQPQRYEYYELYLSYIYPVYEKTEDNSYLPIIIELKAKILPYIDDEYNTADAELELAQLYMQEDNEEKCLIYIQQSIEHYENCLDEYDALWTEPLATIWQLLIYFGYSDYEVIFDRLMEICEANALMDISEKNRALLNDRLNDNEY